MTDIVERLREGCGCNFPETTCMAETECADAFAAADEITALRAENERLNKSRNKWGQKYNKLLEQHKVTRDELATQIQWVKDLADKLIEEEAKTSALRSEVERLGMDYQTARDAHDKLLVENEKLRAALRESADELDAYYRAEYPGDHPYSQKKLEQALATNPARAALEGRT